MIPPDAHAGFVAAMEDVLETYQKPRDPDRPLVCLKVAAWQDHRNKHHAKANWQFTTDDARAKLKRLYPSF